MNQSNLFAKKSCFVGSFLFRFINSMRHVVRSARGSAVVGKCVSERESETGHPEVRVLVLFVH